ncbi:MAG: dipeptidase PepE [Flavobacterium sp.]
MKNMIIASTSTLHGGSYLEYLREEIAALFAGVESIVFIPYARPGGITHDEYTQRAAAFFNTLGIDVRGLHTFPNPSEAITQAEGVFTGGGNTFVLVSQLYKHQVMLPLEQALKNGTPYLGSSAGSNITGLSMQTTNDMPIVYPPSFKTLGAIPFNLNPHYQDPDPNSQHMGETRETRIKEFHIYNTVPVLGLREGSWLNVIDQKIILEGTLTARWFTPNQSPVELPTGTNVLEYV